MITSPERVEFQLFGIDCEAEAWPSGCDIEKGIARSCGFWFPLRFRDYDFQMPESTQVRIADAPKPVFGLFFSFSRLEIPVLIANRRSVSGDFAVSCHPVVVYVEARDYTSAETTGRKSTECDRKSTNIDRNATEMRPNATLLRHFVQVANSGLRRIACDFLTSRIRVGCEPKAHGRPSVGTSSDFVEADVPFDPAHVTFFGVPRVVKKAHLGPNLFEEFHLGSPTDGSGISRAARA